MSSISKPIIPKLNVSNSITTSLLFDALLYEGSGTTTVELQGSNTGTFQPTVPTWARDTYGNVVSFGGAGYIQFSGPTVNTSIFTMMALVKPTTVATAEQTILGCSVDGGIYFALATNTIKVDKSNQAAIGTSTGTISAGVWSMIAVTYDGSGNYIFYINGVAAGSGTNAQSLASYVPQIGARNTGAASFFTGSISLCRIWSRALLNTEIATLYGNPFTIYMMPSFQPNGLRPRAFAPGIAR